MEDLLHEGRPWLSKTLQASRSGNLYRYGCPTIENDRRIFYKKKLHLIKPYHEDYRPNPYLFQYDLEMHIFLNYNDLRRKELVRLNNKLKKSDDEEEIAKIEDRIVFVKENGPTGIPRHEHLHNAAEIRWPTKVVRGAFTGHMVRDPWAIKRFQSICSGYPYIVNFGGGGQGKTWTFMAFGLMLFEHYIFTFRGAKCSFSTVSEDKIKNVGWPHLVKLHTSSTPGISLYSGKSVVAGSYTLKRPNTNDTASVMRGILAGKNVAINQVTDKLTGTHGHEAYFYLVDEAQSSSAAPIEASSNYRVSAPDRAWVILTGNYDEDGDTLGICSQPKLGWDKVDKDTETWDTIIEGAGGAKALVLHFNNENCPAVIDEEIAKRFPHLPNAKKRDIIYDSASKTNNNKGYRRFWIGFRATDLNEDSVLSMPMIESGGAGRPLELSDEYPIHNFLSFDGAQGQSDRNPYGHFRDGRDAETEEWVWGLESPINGLKHVDDIRDYFTETSIELFNICNRLNIKSGAIVMDWSNMNGHVSALREMGMESYPIQYQKNIPDGVSVKGHSGEIEPAIVVNPNSHPVMHAHQVCKLRMSLGAWALQQYVIRGRVRGLNADMIKLISSRTFDDEMLKRKFIDVVDAKHGQLIKLDSKKKFIETYKFSTDIFDVWIQAAYYMLVSRGMPVHDAASDEGKRNMRGAEMDSLIKKEAGHSEISDHNELWEEDAIDDSDTGLYYASYGESSDEEIY